MKSLSFFLFFCLFSETLAAQKTSIGSYALHGHVKVLRRSLQILHMVTLPGLSMMKFFFNQAGKVQRILHHQPFNLSSEDYRYDEYARKLYLPATQ
ncbi:MAG: hypothetical protein ABI203_06960 [Mucilaginibacter sp.]